MNRAEQSLHITVMGLSDVGLVRANNEDCFLIADLTNGIELNSPSILEYDSGPKGSLFVVADGMGGAAGGEVASRMAVESVARFLRASNYNQWTTFHTAIHGSIKQANELIYQESRRDPKLHGMGTTLTAAAIYGSSVLFSQVGDSRAYLIRNNVIAQMTKDQSLIAKLIAAGRLSPERAKTHPQRNVILQAVGSQEQIDVVFSTAELKRGDSLILCSDGLSGKLEDAEMKEVLQRCSSAKDACEKLTAVARERGGEDNITVIVASVDGDRLERPAAGETPIYQELIPETWTILK